MEPLIANGSIGIVGNILTCANFLGGFECVSQSAEESRVAKREIGKMIILVMVASVAWFLLTFVATSLSLPHEAVKGSNLAAVDAMTALFNNNPLAGKAMILVGLLGILTSWISTYITGSRLMFSMSRGGMLPPFLARLHPKYGTPYRAVLVIGVVMLLSGFLGGGVNVWFPSATGFMNTLSYVLVAVSFIQLRRKAPDMPRPYKAPHIMIGVMAVVMGGILLAVSLPGVPNTGLKWPYEILVVVGWILLGIVMFIKIVREPGGLEKIDRNMAEVLIDEETAAK